MRVFCLASKLCSPSFTNTLKSELRTAGRRLPRFVVYALVACLALRGNLAADAQLDQKTSEAELLKEVKVPAGFDATIFAAPPMANYPVSIAAAPDGTLYVSSDGNGSLDRNPHRGRILRLRDLDGDGRADEVKEFVKDVDSPRGLVWDYDRLYLLHPPNISVYIDKDGDGIADEEHVIVKNIGWTLQRSTRRSRFEWIGIGNRWLALRRDRRFRFHGSRRNRWPQSAVARRRRGARPT
jgi:glucose/arabinose dehydrogenase